MKTRMDVKMWSKANFLYISEIALKKPNSTKSTISRSIIASTTTKSMISYSISTPSMSTDSKSALDWATFSTIPSPRFTSTTM